MLEHSVRAALAPHCRSRRKTHGGQTDSRSSSVARARCSALLTAAVDEFSRRAASDADYPRTSRSRRTAGDLFRCQCPEYTFRLGLDLYAGQELPFHGVGYRASCGYCWCSCCTSRCPASSADAASTGIDRRSWRKSSVAVPNRESRSWGYRRNQHNVGCSGSGIHRVEGVF
jgi:hypothetical protein